MSRLSAEYRLVSFVLYLQTHSSCVIRYSVEASRKRESPVVSRASNMTVVQPRARPHTCFIHISGRVAAHFCIMSI